MGEVYTINGVYTPRMTTREALLKAVLAAPDDDLPRLVFADHLEENGESERANWIRYDIAYPHAGFSDLCGKGDIFPYGGREGTGVKRAATWPTSDRRRRGRRWRLRGWGNGTMGQFRYPPAQTGCDLPAT